MVLDSYDLQRELGRGAFGVVHLAARRTDGVKPAPLPIMCVEVMSHGLHVASRDRREDAIAAMAFGRRQTPSTRRHRRDHLHAIVQTM